MPQHPSMPPPPWDRPHEMLAAHTRTRPLAIVSSGVAAVLLAGLMADHVRGAWLWLGGMGVVLALLQALAVVHRHLKPPPEDAWRWLLGFRASVGLHGSVWGMAAAWLFPDTMDYQATLALVLVGVAAAGASRLVTDPVATGLFVLPATLPLAARLLSVSDPLPMTVGAMVLMHALFLVLNARQFERGHREATVLRHAAAQRGSALQHIEVLVAQTGELARVGGWELALHDGSLRVTDQVRRLLDLPPGGRLPPARVLGLVDPPMRARLLRAVRVAMVRGRGFNLEVPVRLEGGRTGWVAANGIADVRDGAVVRLRGALQDVTDRKAVQLNLVAAKEAAEAASRAKSAFLSNMSHEIRTPMHGMLGMVELLATTATTDEQSRCIAVMRRSGRSLLALLDDILDLSKIEAGKLELERQRVDLRSTVESTIALMSPMASQKGLVLEVGFADGLPEQVVADALRLQQVLNNLIGNAIKFTARGRVTVMLWPEPALGAAGIRVCVDDTGPGISPDKVTSLFEPFVQGDCSTARHYGGSGLGLSIARRLVKAMGGEMEAYSTPGVGSRFCFTAALGTAVEAGADDGQPRRGSMGVVTQVGTPVRALRVLLVEDNDVNRTYAVAVLQHLGHRVDFVQDGAAALERVACGERHDVILMDCHMPGMDGFEATRRIREFDRRAGRGRRLVVALTASALDEDRRRCLDCDMDEILTKPFTIDEMRNAMSRLGKRLEAAEPAIA